MAYTWYYSSAYNFGGYKEYRAWLGLDVSSSATTTTVKWSIGVQMKYGSLWGVAASLSGAASGSCEGYLSSSPGGSWKDVCRKDGSVSFTRGHSAVSKSFTSKAYGKTVSGYGSAGGSISVTKSVTVPAKASYTVSYNANGGSGAPGAQTKWYNETLTLSTTKPTRTGYTFAGWYTAASGGSKYGTTYTGNAAATLYAHWTPITYTVSYNANGGSGVPANQTKTYGVNLTLTSLTSSQLPVRQYYKFLGWGTSAGATSATYQPGGTYSSNAAVTLYAVWQYNAYTIKYSANVPAGATFNGTLPFDEETNKEKTFDITNHPTYNLSDGSSFTTTGNTHYITNFSSGGKTYALGSTFTPTVNTTTIFNAEWTESYVLPSVENVIVERRDAYGQFSGGGKNFYLSFTAVPAKGPVNGQLSNFSTTLKIEFHNKNGDTWSTDLDTTINSNYHYDKDIYNIDELYDQFRITMNDPDTSHSEDDQTLISTQEIPPISDYTKEVTTSNFKIQRLGLSSETAEFSFDWTPYYDGHERYETKTIFIVVARFYEVVNGVDSFTGEAATVNVFGTGNGGTITGRFEGNEKIPIDTNAKIFITKATGYKDEIAHPYEIANPIAKAIVSIGGFPIHINESGGGISLFGIAINELDGFEVNNKTVLNNTLDVAGLTSLHGDLNLEGSILTPTIINNTLTVNEKTVMNNTLKVNESILSTKVIEVNNDVNYGVNSVGEGGTWITAIRTDKVSSKKSAISLGVGTGGENMGLYSLRSDNWLFYQNGSGEVHVNSTGQIWVDSGDYVNIKSRSGAGSGFIVRYPNATSYFGFDHSTNWDWHGLYSNINGNSGYLIQRRYSDGRVWANGGRIPLNSNNVLWSGGTGGYYMGDGQSVNLSQNITDQMIGIVLVWSSYDSSAGAHNYDWNFTFVPKWFVQNYNGNGMECILTNTVISSTMSYKYLYIYNNKIVGYKNNTSTGTGYANNAFVLRAVIGV